ncbi:MAG: DegT/DnrJ/EryC1/StrS family aminotransferase [Spirochaetota bacterium]
MFIIDNNIIIDVVTGRSPISTEYELLINKLLKQDKAALSSSSLHTIQYVLRKNYKNHLNRYNELLPFFKIIKTPSYIDLSNKLANKDLEDYLVDLSARSIGGKVVTSDKEFLALSDIAIKPDDCFRIVDNSNNKINFIDLKRQYHNIYSEVERNIDNVLNHGQYIMGAEIAEFEKKLAKFANTKYCYTVSDGTKALLISMMALGIKAGDEVITTPFTFIATGEMIALLGAKPVFVDIDPKTYNIDPKLIEAAITDKTKAIMPVSLYGQCADFDAINDIAARYNLPVIEDGAQSFGATYKKRRSCGLSTIGCTSFFPSKPLGCYGDGGAVFTNDNAIAEKIKWIRVHGQDRRYHHPLIGINGRFDTLQAGIMLPKLDAFKSECAARKKIGDKYTKLLNKMCNNVVTPFIEKHNTSVYAQYTIEVENRDEVVKNLNTAGIPTAIHYPIPLNLQPVFEYLAQGSGSFPVAEVAAKKVMSLPMHPYLKDEEIEMICKAVIS